MKVRDSGMPDEKYWNSFFDTDCIIRKMFGEKGVPGDAAEFGAGYGTFTLTAAKYTAGIVNAFDIEPDLIKELRRRATEKNIKNVQMGIRDFLSIGTGLKPESQAHAMIYNLLHLEQPGTLLNEAYRILKPGGKLSIIHWRSDIETPRGPALEIRPTPEQCKKWLTSAGFQKIMDVDLRECCNYHFGLIAHK